MSKNTIFRLVTHFLGQQNNISVPVPLVRILGDYTAAAFTSQVTYWSDRTTDPEGWFWKTHEQWAEELCLTSDQIRRCVRTSNGLVEVKRAGVPAKNYYRINRELLVERLQGLADGPIVITSRNGETQHLEVDKPNGKSQGTPTASRTADPTSSTKTSSKTTPKTSSKEGGEYNVTGDARANQDPAAPAAELTPAPITTTIAAREERGGQPQPALGGQTDTTSLVAVVSPDGEAADAAITDAELEFQFRDQAPATQETGTLTEAQEIPGGAAARPGAQEAQEALSAADLGPHDPEATRALLVPALGGPRKLHGLMEENPPGLTAGARRGWITRITPERAVEIITAARTEAGGDNPWTYIIRCLDQEVGAQIKRGGAALGAAPTVTPNGASLHAAVRMEVVPDVAPTDVYGVGARWQARDGGEIVTIARTSLSPTRNGKATLYHLSNGQDLKAFELMGRYDHIGADE